MFMGEFLGIPARQPVELRARRYVDDDNQDRTYWAFALRPSWMLQWRRRAARTRLRTWRGKRAARLERKPSD